MRFRQAKNITLGGRRFRGNHMSLMNKYPRLTDLEAPAARRIPKFVFAYLDSGTGQDQAKDHNRAYLDGIELTPQFMRGRVNPDLTTKLPQRWRDPTNRGHCLSPRLGRSRPRG